MNATIYPGIGQYRSNEYYSLLILNLIAGGKLLNQLIQFDCARVSTICFHSSICSK